MSERNFNLETFAGGALAEKINTEIQKVFANIKDVNTEAQKARKITLTLEFKADEKREVIGCNIQAKSALVPTKGITTNLYVDQDLSTGTIKGMELNGQMPNQLSLDTSEVEQDEIRKNSDTVIDLQKVKNK